MLDIAFKEVAAITLAIGAGAQSIILRKGGIAETNGEFQPEYSQFWLYPTYFHEDRSSQLKSTAQLWREQAELLRPPPGLIHLRTLVAVTRVKKLATLEEALALDSLHFWTARTVEERFHYRSPGLYCLFVESRTRSQPHSVCELPAFAGCKSWVKLMEPLPVDFGAAS